ncbi:ATP-binding cassette domain-containing protein [Paenibacillus radicis (ex Xue et al. 2023)]|uniref:ATP-binding cassette domain-containing protein n=1 Tax=Paenibacillus radicis (ex Xue et al. 2023) TaxID=2972489 RepID=A0ABT1YRY9_9BACL|nr:ATP-binding cassette domain-containing protein [Paenibacillus radicis (ex Xue et al. 2023)]MCR8635068.1 ATP-binding cassette domain-containing protein [Paenibacillus radicis (ex Xue et al. 2023)]
MNFGEHLIKLEHVSFAYASAEKAPAILQDVNLTIRRGEWVAIAGTNGSGKSTLAKLIAMLTPATSGELSFNIPEQPPIQLVFQNPDTQVIGETVYEDVCFGMENYGIAEPEIHLRAQTALQKVGLEALADRPVAELSGGQKQLLAIASCLCMNPPALLFDEATSMLDPRSRHNIIQVAQELHREGKTIIWITQWMDELAWAERVVALDQGKVAYNGSTLDFFYQTDEHNQSFCDRLGFAPPYTVQVALSLVNKGFKLDSLPVTPAELGKIVSVHL